MRGKKQAARNIENLINPALFEHIENSENGDKNANHNQSNPAWSHQNPSFANQTRL